MRDINRVEHGEGRMAERPSPLSNSRTEHAFAAVAASPTDLAWPLRWWLVLFGLAALLGSPMRAAGAPPPEDDADASEASWVEEETDDLPPWAEAELDDARAALVSEPGGSHAVDLEGYGTGIPSPEEVVRGGAPLAPAAPPAPASPAAPIQPPVATAAPPAERVVFEDFRQGLDAHGRWVDTPEYGWVFVPYRQTEVSGWRPYLYGQWVWTVYGWTWVSDEPFGWATYHYGRWAYRPSLGWIWVPGYTWAPAWVVWRHGDGVVGWAPLYPGYVSFGASYPFHASHWVFVAPTRFYGVSIHLHWFRDRGSYYYARTKWTRNWRHPRRGAIYAGPPRRFVEVRGGIRVHETQVVAVRSPDRRGMITRGAVPHGELRIYRPTNRGAVRPGRPAGTSRGSLQSGPPPRRIGSGLGARELPPETRRELSRSARPGRGSSSSERGNLRPARPSGSSGRGSVAPSRPSSPSERGNVRPARPSTPSGRGNIAPSRPSTSSERGAERPSRPPSPTRRERGDVAPARPASPSEGGRARPSTSASGGLRELAPGRSSSSSERGNVRPGRSSSSSGRGDLAPRGPSPSTSSERRNDRDPARSSSRSDRASLSRPSPPAVSERVAARPSRPSRPARNDLAPTRRPTSSTSSSRGATTRQRASTSTQSSKRGSGASSMRQPSRSSPQLNPARSPGSAGRGNRSSERGTTLRTPRQQPRSAPAKQAPAAQRRSGSRSGA